MKNKRLTASVERVMRSKAEAIAVMDIKEAETAGFKPDELRLARRDTSLAKAQIAFVLPELDSQVRSEIRENYPTALERFAYLYRKAINKRVMSYA